MKYKISKLKELLWLIIEPRKHKIYYIPFIWLLISVFIYIFYKQETFYLAMFFAFFICIYYLFCLLLSYPFLNTRFHGIVFLLLYYFILFCISIYDVYTTDFIPKTMGGIVFVDKEKVYIFNIVWLSIPIFLAGILIYQIPLLFEWMVMFFKKTIMRRS